MLRVSCLQARGARIDGVVAFQEEISRVMIRLGLCEVYSLDGWIRIFDIRLGSSIIVLWCLAISNDDKVGCSMF